MVHQDLNIQRALIVVAGLLLVTAFAHAQLTDQTQTTPNVPGGAIGKSLQEQIGQGRGDTLTPGSSIYLIRRDPARSIRRGRQLFQRKFTQSRDWGLGSMRMPVAIFTTTRLSAPDWPIVVPPAMGVRGARRALVGTSLLALIAGMPLTCLASASLKCSLMK